ncbi:acyltransferase family protein [Pedobacter miscanthi]|uniref:Acyltransferase n=1 Tax=Pedobacter miscanthi TaxID=2259170 RepID=A0A366LDE6_9SPHI|nr:acyltransferase [Pedobacter miscanthi]RBQ11800.1 acyltransferase [Pedobacter miscanthi]
MKHRFVVLDVFRGIFATLVVFYHMSAFSDTPILNNAFIENADLFVDFFFVLSGFVICYSYRSINAVKNISGFLYKRLIRLYPLHLLMLLLFLGVEGIKYFLAGRVQINNSLDNSTLTFITSFFLLNSIDFPGVRDISWNLVSWSISAEFISYVVFALSCFSLSHLKSDRLKPIAYFLLAALAGTLIYNFTGSARLDYTYNYGFLRGIIGFFTGSLCFYLFDFSHNRLSKWSAVLFTVLEISAVIIVGFMVVNGKEFRQLGILFEPVFFVSVFIFAFQKGYLSLMLSKSGLLEKMGKYSYSIYMVHTLFISVFNVLFIRILKFPPAAYGYLFIINYLVIYLVAGWTYRNIEMRFQKKLQLQKKP